MSSPPAAVIPITIGPSDRKRRTTSSRVWNWPSQGKPCWTSPSRASSMCGPAGTRPLHRRLRRDHRDHAVGVWAAPAPRAAGPRTPAGSRHRPRTQAGSGRRHQPGPGRITRPAATRPDTAAPCRLHRAGRDRPAGRTPPGQAARCRFQVPGRQIDPVLAERGRRPHQGFSPLDPQFRREPRALQHS